MFDWLVVILIIAGAFIVFKVVRASSKPKPEPMPATGRSGRTTPIPDQTKPPKRKSDNFNAVVFVAGNYPCEAASRFHRKRLRYAREWTYRLPNVIVKPAPADSSRSATGDMVCEE